MDVCENEFLDQLLPENTSYTTIVTYLQMSSWNINILVTDFDSIVRRCEIPFVNAEVMMERVQAQNDEATCLGCGHQFSSGRWCLNLMAGLEIKVTKPPKHPDHVIFTCLHPGCKAVVTKRFMMGALSYHDDFHDRLYQDKYLERYYLQFTDSVGLKKCPITECQKLVKKNENNVCKCDCGTTFCFKCDHEEDHYPAECETLTKWRAMTETSESNDYKRKFNAQEHTT